VNICYLQLDYTILFVTKGTINTLCLDLRVTVSDPEEQY